MPAPPPSSGRALAASFDLVTTEASQVGRAVGVTAAGVGEARGALIFASGAVAEQLDDIVTHVRAAIPGVPFVVATGAGVLTERAEHEGTSAAAGVVWRGGNVEPILVPSSTASEQIGAATVDAVRAALGDRTGTAAIFALPGALGPRSLDDLSTAAPRAAVFGAGTTPAGGVVVGANGRASRGAVVGLGILGLARPALRTSAACRLLAPMTPITEARGSMVLAIGGEPALDVLAASGKGLPDQPLVLAVLAQDATRPGRGGVIVRGLRGVDPVKRAVVISDEATVGTRIAFAVRDGASARVDLESALRDVHREIAGAAPRFGVFITCAGRGARLYGATDVEPRILRARFGTVPFAGMFSTFEIGPMGDRTTMHLYTGVLALFASPS